MTIDTAELRRHLASRPSEPNAETLRAWWGIGAGIIQACLIEIDELNIEVKVLGKRPQIETLAEASEAFIAIVSALAARRLLAKGIANPTIHAKIAEDLRTDAELEGVAADAFEKIVVLLASTGYPGATAFSCNPTE